MELLNDERNIMLQFGSLPPVKRGPCAVANRVQFETLLSRKIILTLVDKHVVAIMVLSKFVTAMQLGLIFQDSFYKSPKGVTSIPVIMIVGALGFIRSQTLLPIMIHDRGIMKHEELDGLYLCIIWITAGVVVDFAISTICEIPCTLILFLFASFPMDLVVQEYLPFHMGMTTQADSVFGFIAAWATNDEIAQVVSGSILPLAMLFNGVVISENSAPSFLRFFFWCSPPKFALDIGTYGIYHDHYPDAWASLEELFGCKKSKNVEYVVILAVLFVLCRAMQLRCFHTRNNIQK